MKLRIPLGWICLLGSVVLLTGCMSLAADITPPPGYVTPQPVVDQPAEVSTVFPIVPPDPAAGAVTFASECAPCHGAAGRGGGSMSANLPEPPPEIGSPELARASRPSDWFNMVTNGNLEKLMPGFKASLDDRSRWDVVAYVFTLSTSQEELAQGKTIYEVQCVECHGADGRGAGQDVPDLTDQQRMAQLSAQEIEQVVSAGQGSMPAYIDTLNEGDRWAVVSYTRSLTFTGASVPVQAAQDNTPSVPVEAPAALVIRGQVVPNGAAVLPEQMKVTLFGFEGMNQSFEQSADITTGQYEFKDVPFSAGMAYLVQVNANGFLFNSEVLQATDVTGAEAELPVTIYETTSDASSLTIDRLHVFFDFSLAGKVQVVELFIVSNPTDKVVVPAAADQPSISFMLPEGATNLVFDSGELGGRYVATQGGFGEMAPISPGSGAHQILFSYELPYERKLSLSLPVPLDVASSVVMVPPGGVKLSSTQLQPAGQRSVQGMNFDLFTGANLTAGSSLNLQLSGKVKSGESNPNNLANVLIGAGVFGLALIIAGLWLVRQRRLQTADVVEPLTAELPGESEEAILDAILALDDLFQAGSLPQEAYTERRAALKARLAAVYAKRGEDA